MSDVDEIKSPFLRKNIEERGIIDDLVTDLLIVERYLRRPELTDVSRRAHVARRDQRSSFGGRNRQS